jgi:hypothetical protein
MTDDLATRLLATIAPWFVVEHCCEAGSVAYPEVCPWHPDYREDFKP